MVGKIETVLRALNDHGVRYLIVGGVAVVLHGHLRTTADLDLIVQLSTDNLQRALEALAALGYQPMAPVPAEHFLDPAQRRLWIEQKNMQVFSFWSAASPGAEIDLFVEEPLDFEAAYGRAIQVPLETVEATVVALEDLLHLKRLAGRSQDLVDIEALQKIRSET